MLEKNMTVAIFAINFGNIFDNMACLVSVKFANAHFNRFIL